MDNGQVKMAGLATEHQVQKVFLFIMQPYMTSVPGRNTHKTIQLLIPPRRILLIVLRYPHHLRYSHSINLAERLYHTKRVSQHTLHKQIIRPIFPPDE